MKHRPFARVLRTLFALALFGAPVALPAGIAAARTAAAPPAAATSYQATIRDGRAAAQALLEQSGAASLSLALVSGERVVWQETFGYADKATSTAPEADTMYGIGSVSKILAAVAVMKLVDEGKVELDAPFTRYVPAFSMLSPAYRQITVRMLLDHSSGLPGSTYGNDITGAYYPGYLQQVLDTLAMERLKTTPGYMSVYCNDGYTLLEALVPAVTGKAFPGYVQDEILTPLGMAHSAYPLRTFADGTYARCYRGDAARPFEVVNLLAAGGLYSTPADMSRLGAMLMNGGIYNGTRILSADAVAQMAADETLGSFNPVPCTALRYGLGWDTVTQPGLKAVGVTGWQKGGDSADYHASFIVAPGPKLAVTVTGVAPLGSASLGTLGEGILLHALVDQGRIHRRPTPISPKLPAIKPATAAQLAEMKGYWALSSQMFRVAAEPSAPQSLTLSMLTGDGWTTVAEGLRLRTDGRFHAGGSASGYSTITAGGRRYLVNDWVGGYGHYRDAGLMSQKLQPGDPLPSAWASRSGEVWLAVNEQPDSFTYTSNAGPLLIVSAVPGLEGWVTVTTPAYGTQVVDPIGDHLGAMFLQIPGGCSRDLEDAVVTQHGAEEWIQWGSTAYRPMGSAPALAAGPNTVTFGAEGYAEWRSLAAAGMLTIAAGGASTWRLYGPDLAVLDAGTTFPATVTAPTPRCYLLLFGPAGSSTTVTVTPPPGAPSRAAEKSAAGRERRAALWPEYVPRLR